MSRALPDPGVRAFLLVSAGQVVSLLGSGLTAFALGVFIYQKSASTTQYALVMFCATLPPLVVLPLAGPIVDRWSRRRILVLCEAAGAAAALAIGGLVRAGMLTLPAACAIVALMASAAALQWPAWAATVTLLVPRAHLGRASGVTQLAQATSQVLSPLLAGFLIGAVGLAGITVIDALTFLFAIATILAAALPERDGSGAAPGASPEEGSGARRAGPDPRGEGRGSGARGYWRDVRLGWSYIFGRSGLTALLLLFAAINFFSELASVLFTPLVLTFATPAALGTIVAVGGLGMIAGGVVMSLWGGPRRAALGAVLFAAAGGLAVLGAGLTTSVTLLAAAAFVFFFFGPLATGTSQALWQRRVPPELQGRVFSARAALAMSAIPLATLVAGPLADRIFEPAMAPGGPLASALGPLCGVGRGRGIALILVAAGAASILAAALAVSFRPLRRLDQVADSERGGAGAVAAETT